jgi:ATP-dependent protease ClpP protease subunit
MNLIQIDNRIGKVKLNDAVTPWSSDDLIGDIEKLYGAKAVAENLKIGEFTAKADDALETLEIEINSPGGSVLDGYRVYHSIMGMRDRGVRVVATGNGIVASMASVIFMAADERRITQGSRIMIHEAQQAVAGDSETHARAAKILDEMSDEIAAIYAGVTGSPKSEMRELMKKETWMGASEAVERKFADSIVNKSPVDIRGTGPKSQNNQMSILDRLLPNGELQAKLDFANGELVAKDVEIQNLTGKIKEADTLLAQAVEEVRELKEKAEAAEAQAKAEAEAREQAEKAKEEAEEASKPEAIEAKALELVACAEAPAVIADAISAKAAAMIASAGHTPVEVTEITGADNSATPHLDKFESLKGSEATSYFKEFKKQINAEARLRK